MCPLPLAPAAARPPRSRRSQGGEIDFLTYLDAVNRAQLSMYENSEQGQAALAKSGKLPVK